MSTHFIEHIDDALQSVREAQHLPLSSAGLRLLKDAENALYGAAKVWLAEQPKAAPAPSPALTNNSWAEHKRKNAEEWRCLAHSWERVRDGARALSERSDAERQMQHAHLMAEACEAGAAELERAQ